jgi:hypothetical protein
MLMHYAARVRGRVSQQRSNDIWQHGNRREQGGDWREVANNGVGWACLGQMM